VSEDPTSSIDDLLADSTKKAPKNPKGSARQKFNRRKLWLGHALEQMDIAIAEVLAQEGTIYKRDEIDTLSRAISDLRDKTGLKAPELKPLTQEEQDGFLDMLCNLKAWEPPSKDELAKLYASIGVAPEAAEDS
jgi:hypothetical protein